MWKVIPGFTDYKINESGCIYKVSTTALIHCKPTVSLKADDGQWKNRSVNKLAITLFDLNTVGIYAEPLHEDLLRPRERMRYFATIKDAAEWLISTKQAIHAGKLAAYNTVRNNIKHAITQPELYPYVYGYVWSVKLKGDITE